MQEEYSSGYSYIAYLAVQRGGEHRKSNVLQKLDFLKFVASAKRSGQGDFQRGTPPVSLASRSISLFLRACNITEWSTKDQKTDSTGTPILIYCSNSTCDYMETLRLGTFFWLQHPQSLFRRKTNELDNQKTKTKSHAITKQFHTPTLIYLSTPESTAIFGVPSTRNQAQKNESYEETPTCVLRHRNLPNRPKQ